MKIAVIGFSGSGKSTLAQKLGKHYNISVLHLDTVHHLPGWKERDDESKKTIVKNFLNDNSSWVIDGNYSKLYYERRMQEADLIVMLLFNRFNCLFRAYKRYRKYKGKSRPDMTEGCDEKLDFEFVRWILHDGRTKSKKEMFKQLKLQYADKAVMLKNQKQLDRFEKSLINNRINVL